MTPSPSAYNPDIRFESTHIQLPSYSLGALVNNPKPFLTPSPSAYNPDIRFESTHIQQPSYSLGAKVNGAHITNVGFIYSRYFHFLNLFLKDAWTQIPCSRR